MCISESCPWVLTRPSLPVVDDEVIIHIPFTQSVNLRSVLLKLGSSVSIRSLHACNRFFAGRGEFTPQRMRIYANYPNIVDFSEGEDLAPHLDITLSTDMESVQAYPVNQGSTAFVSVNSLSLFFVRSSSLYCFVMLMLTLLKCRVKQRATRFRDCIISAFGARVGGFRRKGRRTLSCALPMPQTHLL